MIESAAEEEVELAELSVEDGPLLLVEEASLEEPEEPDEDVSALLSEEPVDEAPGPEPVRLPVAPTTPVVELPTLTRKDEPLPMKTVLIPDGRPVVVSIQFHAGC